MRSADSLAARVTALADEYVREFVARFPEDAEGSGMTIARHDGLTDNSLAARREWEARQDAWAAELARIDGGARWGRPEWVTHGMLREQLEAERGRRVCRRELWPVSQLNGWQAGLAELAGTQPVGTAELRAQALAPGAALPGHRGGQPARGRAAGLHHAPAQRGAGDRPAGRAARHPGGGVALLRPGAARLHAGVPRRLARPAGARARARRAALPRLPARRVPRRRPRGHRRVGQPRRRGVLPRRLPRLHHAGPRPGGDRGAGARPRGPQPRRGAGDRARGTARTTCSPSWSGSGRTARSASAAATS
ncbi:MAG TPA: hypothetical protein VFQ76_18135 [Longimicrobiaceae bacterium]|nr:hypothetical protein [Longimicrobiaceae bacterium]